MPKVFVDKAKKSKNQKDRKIACNKAVEEIARFKREYEYHLDKRLSKAFEPLLPGITKASEDAAKLKGSKEGNDVNSCLDEASEKAFELVTNLVPKLDYLNDAIRLIKEGADSGDDYLLVKATNLLARALTDCNSQMTLVKDRYETVGRKISNGLGWLKALMKGPVPLVKGIPELEKNLTNLQRKW